MPCRARIHCLQAAFLVAALAVSSGCSDRGGPRVEAWKDGTYRPRAVTAYAFQGRRSGAVTTAISVFTLDDGSHLQVELTIHYDPTPMLGSGHWHHDAGLGVEGEVQAESVKFLGGQGEGPSLGGRFRLDENGAPRFRVTLPVRPVQTGWPNP